MANYPQLDNARGVWNMKEVYDAVMGGYWPLAGSRFITAGGTNPSYDNTMDYVTIATLGNAKDFGDLVTAVFGNAGGAASSVRGVSAGGYTPTTTDTIQYIQFTTTGDAVDFGNLTAGTGYLVTVSNGHGGLG